jgi:hypothetical protein
MNDVTITKQGHRPSDAALAAVDRVMIDRPWNMSRRNHRAVALVATGHGYKVPVNR